MSSAPHPAGSPDGTARPRDDELDVFGLTHVGKVRRENQDHFLFCTVHKSLRVVTTSLSDPEVLEIPSQRLASMFMVADGVGGREGGEAASRVTVETMALYATHAMRCYFRANEADDSEFLCRTAGRGPGIQQQCGSPGPRPPGNEQDGHHAHPGAGGLAQALPAAGWGQSGLRIW